MNNNYSCQCTSEYMGQNCTEDINKCDSNPCKNGGTCSVRQHIDNNCHRMIIIVYECDIQNYSVGDYTCDCAMGFTGPTCATNIDECE